MPKNNLEITKMLTVSSAHIPPETWDMIHAHACLGTGDYLVTAYAKDEYGFFLYLSEYDYTNDARLSRDHPDLVKLMNLAVDNGCGVLCLDVDAEPLPGFTDYSDAFDKAESDQTPDGPNTRLHYLYVDANNYKCHNTCVIHGRLTSEQQAVILDSLSEGEFFVPSAIGLPEYRGDIPDPAADHPWFKLTSGFAEYVPDAPDCDITAETLTAKFVKTGPSGWQK